MSLNGLTTEEVAGALSHLLEAPGLQISDRNKRFLRYVVEETLAGRGDRIKSYAVAVDVFGRGPNFDGSADSIVRTEATRLRGALTRYYAGEGANEPIRITLPPGSYMPQFESRAVVAAPPPTEDVELAQRVADPSLSPPVSEAAPGQPPPSRWRMAPRWAAAAAVILLAGALALAYRHEFQQKSVSVAPTIILVPTQPGGEGAKIRGLAQGLTQSLVLSLTRYEGLMVARASERNPVEAVVANERGKGGTLYILESSIDAEGAKLRFRWRLIDAANQYVLWTDQVEEDLNASSAFNVEDRIADGVARIVGARGGVVALSEEHKQESHSTAGYACVLRAMSYLSSLSATLHAEVRDCLEETIAQDPNYADALAMLAYVNLDEDRNGFNPRGSKQEILARASALSDRAAQLAPSSSLVQQMRSVVFFQMGNYPAFEEAARKAITLNPGNPDRLILFGNRLFALGRYEEGAALVRRGLALKPLPTAVDRGIALLDAYRLGNYQAAAEEAKPLDIDPDYYLLDAIIAAIDGELGDKAAAAPHLRKVLKLRPDYAKTFRADWRNRHFQEDLIDKLADGLRKAGLAVE